jgi:hypothetical protein
MRFLYFYLMSDALAHHGSLFEGWYPRRLG